MAREEYHVRMVRLDQVREYLRMALQDLGPQERQDLQKWLELLEHVRFQELSEQAFRQLYPEQFFPDLHSRLRRGLLELQKRGVLELPEWAESKLVKGEGLLTFKTRSKSENWATGLGWFVPRKHRHVIGDILEDCAEMREAGCTERRIKFHVVYQWVIAVVTLVPAAVKTSIVDAVRQVISRPK